MSSWPTEASADRFVHFSNDGRWVYYRNLDGGQADAWFPDAPLEPRVKVLLVCKTLAVFRDTVLKMFGRIDRQMSELQKIAYDELEDRGYKRVRTSPWSGETDRGDIEHWTHETKRSVLLVTFEEHGGWDLFAEVDVTRSSEGGSTFRQLDGLNGEPL